MVVGGAQPAVADGASFATVGQAAAVAAIRAMLRRTVPHAVLLVGPPSVGKMRLALDLAAGLLCEAAPVELRPCGMCRGCRMVEHGNHADLHRLDPEGPGGQVGIGGTNRPRGVRDLVAELALLPVEGGARVAIIRDAHRMNEDAQSALLKTLEEPPARTTLILCADDEEGLLPTVRSRCARVRLGHVGTRAIEQLLGERGLADPPTAARLARLAGGRVGLAIAYAAAPEAERVHGELVRTLIDLLPASHAERLAAARELMGRASTLGALLAPSPAGTPGPSRRRGSDRAWVTPTGSAARVGDPGVPAPAGRVGGMVAEPLAPAGVAASPDLATATDETPAPGDAGRSGRAPAAERRRALGLLLEAWRNLARDLALADRGASRSVRDPALLEELEAAARTLPPGSAARALERLVRARELLDANVSPELLLDVLLVRWPRPGPAVPGSAPR
jgi:DNA polymerase III delta' subunit